MDGKYTISTNVSFSRIGHMNPPRCNGAAKCNLFVCLNEKTCFTGNISVIHAISF